MFPRIKTRLTAIRQPQSLRRLSILLVVTFGVSMAQAQSGGLTLSEALRLSLQHSSFAKAADASIQASREAVAKAGQLPDPMFKAGIENVPVNGPDRWSTTRDFMTMRRVGIEQQWVSADKRAARVERAHRMVELEEGNYLESVAKVREETAKAWVNVLYSQRTLALLKAMQKATAEDLTALEAAHRGAKATASEVLQARLALIQAQDASRKAEQELANARIVLARWTLTSIESVANETPLLVSHVAALAMEELEKYHPLVLAARRAINLADAETAVATRERNPDWTVEAGFSQRGSQYSNMVSIGVSIPLPINRAQRQDRDIAEKSALGTKARLQYEDALRQMQAEIHRLSATLASQKHRLAQLTTQLLPPASSQVELATAAYRAGTGSLSAVFNARKMLLETQLQVTELEKEAALTWAELEHHVVPLELISARKAAQ